KQISDEEKTDFLRDLSELMVDARDILSDSGGVITLRRLNRREYANTIEELLGIRPDTSFLPDDQASSEFDTMGASLFFSSDQLEQYLKTARNTLELALFPSKDRPSEIVRTQPEEHYIPHYAKLASELMQRGDNYYKWVEAGRTDDVAQQFGFLDSWEAERAVNGFNDQYPPLRKWLSAPENKTGAAMMVTIKDGMTSMHLPRLRPWQPGKYIIRVKAGAYRDDPDQYQYLEFIQKIDRSAKRLGWRKVAGTVRKPEIIELEIDHPQGLDANYIIQKRLHMDRGTKNIEAAYRKENTYGTPWGVWVDWFELEGPLPEEPNAAVASFLSKPSEGQTESEHIRAAIANFVSKAFRGTEASDAYIDKLLVHYQSE
ncbi:MAG: DUF1587 domain-containing protein, partial [Verrucomicrobiota bacterium]